MPNEGLEVRREAKERKLEARDKFVKIFKRRFKLKRLQSGVSKECLPNP